MILAGMTSLCTIPRKSMKTRGYIFFLGGALSGICLFLLLEPHVTMFVSALHLQKPALLLMIVSAVTAMVASTMSVIHQMRDMQLHEKRLALVREVAKQAAKNIGYEVTFWNPVNAGISPYNGLAILFLDTVPRNPDHLRSYSDTKNCPMRSHSAVSGHHSGLHG
jgi:hypothetical protein